MPELSNVTRGATSKSSMEWFVPFQLASASTSLFSLADYSFTHPFPASGGANVLPLGAYLYDLLGLNPTEWSVTPSSCQAHVNGPVKGPKA